MSALTSGRTSPASRRRIEAFAIRPKDGTIAAPAFIVRWSATPSAGHSTR
jgi:hypothetical protein